MREKVGERKRMTRTDKILFLISLLLLCLFASLPERSTPVTETVLVTPEPVAVIGDIDLNTADAETLQRLPGVGPVIAERILYQRLALGGFSCAEELVLVDGIGEKTMIKIYEYMEDQNHGTR